MKPTFLTFLLAISSLAFAESFVIEDFDKNSIAPQSSIKLKSGLPTKYDHRGDANKLAPRDQGTDKTCWAFSIANTIQSAWIKEGFSCNYLSPKHTITCSGTNRNFDNGGDYIITSAYLTRGEGPVWEEDCPYVNTSVECCEVENSNKAPLVGAILYLPQTVADIKQAVYNYGAVSVSMSEDEQKLPYFDKINSSAYKKEVGTSVADHAVTIIGWDDEFNSFDNLTEKPTQPGAWIVENSYGSRHTASGYFYASYHSAIFGKTPVTYANRIDRSQTDTIYGYDYYGFQGKLNAGKDSCYLTIGYNIATEQNIHHIGITTNNADLHATFQIGQDGGSVTQTVDTIFNYAGYHTIPVNLDVTAGLLIVQIKLKTSDGSNISVPIEKYLEQDGYTATPTLYGMQYLGFTANSIATQLSTETMPYNFLVKAYAKNKAQTSTVTSPLKHNTQLIINQNNITIQNSEDIPFTITDINGNIILNGICNQTKYNPISKTGVYILKTNNYTHKFFIQK